MVLIVRCATDYIDQVDLIGNRPTAGPNQTATVRVNTIAPKYVVPSAIPSCGEAVSVR